MDRVSSLKTDIKYKNTPIGRVPVDWEVARLGDLCIGDPEYGANVAAISKDINLPRYIRITDIAENGRLSESTWQSIKREFTGPYILEEGDFLFARSGATVGKTYLYRKNDGECAFAGYTIRYKPNPSQLSPEFLFHYTHSPYYYNWVKGILRAGAQPNINSKEYSNMLLAKPPLAEQIRIAAILTSVDEPIEKTTRIIEKAKEVKRGLMQRLLNRGIHHKKFKRTEIGEIPIGWEVCKISEIVSRNKNAIKAGPFGSALKKSIFVESGYRVYGQEQVIPNDFSIGNYYISEEKFNQLKDFEVKPNDILISLVGTFGRISVVPENVEEGIINPRLIKISPDTKKVLPEFLKNLLTSDLLQRQMDRYTHGGTMGILNAKIIKSLIFPIPPVNEQNSINLVLHEVDVEIDKETIHKKQLGSLKRGLMQILLTGKIRVRT